MTDNFRDDLTIYYQEIETADSPKWIKIDPTVYKADRNSNFKVVYDSENPIPIRIKKKGNDERPLEGVTFRLEYRTSSTGTWRFAETLTTDRNGEAVSKNKFTRDNIAAGNVRITETSLGTKVKGYTMPANKVFVISYSDVKKR